MYFAICMLLLSFGTRAAPIQFLTQKCFTSYNTTQLNALRAAAVASTFAWHSVAPRQVLLTQRHKTYKRSQWPSGYRVRLQCERTQVRISPRTVVFIAIATAICSLGHALRLLQTAMPQLSLAFLWGRKIECSFGFGKGGKLGISPQPGGR